MSKRPQSPRGRSHDPRHMRENGVRSLFVSCWNCHHRAALSSAERRPLARAIPCSALLCLLPPGADMVRKKAPEEPSGWTPAPASANGPACDFERHACHFAGRRPRPLHDRAPRLGASRPTDDNTPTRNPVERTPGGRRRGTRPRQVSVGDQQLGCGAADNRHALVKRLSTLVRRIHVREKLGGRGSQPALF
jgi:hypothetical protein